MHEEAATVKKGFNSVLYNIRGYEVLALNRIIADKMLGYNTFLMHGAVVAYRGEAYMFAAPSGTGKTTRIRLWLDEYPDSFVVNGDKPLIKIDNEKAYACGTPWCGKEGWNRNTIVPLRAIYLLERSDFSKKNKIEEVKIGEAFPDLLTFTEES